MAKVVGVTHIGTYLRCEEFGCIRSIFSACVAVEPGEVGKGKRLGVWAGRIGDLWLRFTEVRSHRSLCASGMVGLRSGGALLLELNQLFLDFLQLVLQLLDLLILNIW